MLIDLHDPKSLLLLSGILFILLIAWIVRLEIRLRNLLVGAGSKNLDHSLKTIAKEIEELQKFKEEDEHYLITVEKRLKRSLQAVETLRFNPFKGSGTGGNQSFATAFLNEKGDGVLFSSLYAHDRMSIYSKPLTNFSSEFELSEEERDAVKKSKETLKK
jgi:hypothetical protein